MTWEAITALSTLFTGIVILLTVVLGAHQLVQLRKATQLEGIMKIADSLRDPEYQNALRFVRNGLAARLQDDDFNSDWHSGSALALDPCKHPEVIVLMAHELIGTYVKEGLVDGSTVYELCGLRIIMSWERLKSLVEHIRAATGEASAWENTEFLSKEAVRWKAAKGAR